MANAIVTTKLCVNVVKEADTQGVVELSIHNALACRLHALVHHFNAASSAAYRLPAFDFASANVTSPLSSFARKLF